MFRSIKILTVQYICIKKIIFSSGRCLERRDFGLPLHFIRLGIRKRCLLNSCPFARRMFVGFSQVNGLSDFDEICIVVLQTCTKVLRNIHHLKTK